MSSIKCPNCGLINFASAEACKRCKQALEAPAYPYWQGKGAVVPPKPDWSKLQTDPAADLVDHTERSHTVGNILFAVYLGLHMIMLPIALVALGWVMTQESWELFTTPTNRLYLPTFAPLYYVTLLGIVIYLPASVILFVRLLQKSETFLTWVVIYLLGEFVYSIIQGVLMWGVSGEMIGKHIPQFEASAVRMQGSIASCVISILIVFLWFRYFTSSKRARAVFAW
ncbi:MAG TPA: zinc finger Ran-binding domain-containing protein [Pyrinomonadaceae bacterium]|nr:zinc finger Ran-binding domain-containing protein [Pyrinomonadaceae bacterium]